MMGGHIFNKINKLLIYELTFIFLTNIKLKLNFIILTFNS